MRKTSTFTQNGVGTARTIPELKIPVASLLLSGVIALPLLVACDGTSPAKSALSQPPTLATTTITLRGHQIVAECAVTDEEKARGLMFRKSLPENHGMLFYYAKPQRAGFWMKNTLIPLSIAFINAEGKVLEIYQMTPLDTTPVTSRSFEVMYALEMNQGWFEKNGIKPGDMVLNIPDFQPGS